MSGGLGVEPRTPVVYESGDLSYVFTRIIFVLVTWGLAVLPSSSPRSCFLLVGSCNPIHALNVCVCVCVSGWGRQGVGGDRRTIPRWRLLPPAFAVPGGASSEASFVKVLEVLRLFLFDIISQPGWGRNC